MSRRFGIATLLSEALLLLFGIVAAFAQEQSSLVPVLGPVPALSLSSVAQSTLPNGLRLFVVEDHRQPTIYLRLAVSAGVVLEPPGKAGVALITAGMLTLSTATRNGEQIAEQVDSAGAGLHAEAEPDYLGVSIYGPVAHAGEFCDLLSDVTEHPGFPAGALTRFRESGPSLVARVFSEPAALAEAALDRVLYGMSPYADVPTLDSINALTRDDVLAFYDRNFSPASSILFIVGDITDAAARAMALKSFGGWTAAKPAVIVPPSPAAVAAVAPVASGNSKPTILIIDRPGSQQTEVRIGVKTGGYSDPQRIAGNVAMAVLGVGQFSSRLTKEIRDTRGLTYSVGSAFERHRDAGVFHIRTFTKNVSTGEVLRLTLAEVRKAAETPPSPTELADHKTYLNGSYAVSLASVEGFLGHLLNAVIYGDGPDALTQYVAKINSVTGQEVSNVVAGLHIESAHIVLVGDAKVIEPQVRDIGPVTVIEPNELDLDSPTLLRPGGASAVALPAALPPPPPVVALVSNGG